MRPTLRTASMRSAMGPSLRPPLLVPARPMREDVDAILIYTPGVRGLAPLVLIWLQLFVAVFFSFGILWYVSIPAFLLIGIQFPRLIECWKLYGYSKRFAYGSTAIVLALFFLTANHVRPFIVSLFLEVLRALKILRL